MNKALVSVWITPAVLVVGTVLSLAAFFFMLQAVGDYEEYRYRLYIGFALYATSIGTFLLASKSIFTTAKSITPKLQLMSFISIVINSLAIVGSIIPLLLGSIFLLPFLL